MERLRVLRSYTFRQHQVYVFRAIELTAYQFDQDVEPKSGLCQAVLGLRPISETPGITSSQTNAYLDIDGGVLEGRHEQLCDIALICRAGRCIVDNFAEYVQQTR